jgi:hypothetical protein
MIPQDKTEIESDLLLQKEDALHCLCIKASGRYSTGRSGGTMSPCSMNDVHRASKVNGQWIEQCMEGTRMDISNSLLDAVLDVQMHSGIAVIPSVLVNDVPIRDELKAHTCLEPSAPAL